MLEKAHKHRRARAISSHIHSMSPRRTVRLPDAPYPGLRLAQWARLSTRIRSGTTGFLTSPRSHATSRPKSRPSATSRNADLEKIPGQRERDGPCRGDQAFYTPQRKCREVRFQVPQLPVTWLLRMSRRSGTHGAGSARVKQPLNLLGSNAVADHHLGVAVTLAVGPDRGGGNHHRHGIARVVQHRGTARPDCKLGRDVQDG